MGDTIGWRTVVMEEIPLTFVLHDGVVCGPAYDRLEDDSLIAEWSVGVVADGIAQQMAVASGVREVVFALILVHP